MAQQQAKGPRFDLEVVEVRQEEHEWRAKLLVHAPHEDANSVVTILRDAEEVALPTLNSHGKAEATVRFDAPGTYSVTALLGTRKASKRVEIPNPSSRKNIPETVTCDVIAKGLFILVRDEGGRPLEGVSVKMISDALLRDGAVLEAATDEAGACELHFEAEAAVLAMIIAGTVREEVFVARPEPPKEPK